MLTLGEFLLYPLEAEGAATPGASPPTIGNREQWQIKPKRNKEKEKKRFFLIRG
jgi:hypothetical protein